MEASTDRRRDVFVRLPESQARALAAAAEVGSDVPDFIGTDHLETDVALALDALQSAIDGPKIVIKGDPPTFTVTLEHPDGTVTRGYGTLIEALDAIDVWRGLQ